MNWNKELRSSHSLGFTRLKYYRHSRHAAAHSHKFCPEDRQRQLWNCNACCQFDAFFPLVTLNARDAFFFTKEELTQAWKKGQKYCKELIFRKKSLSSSLLSLKSKFKVAIATKPVLIGFCRCFGIECYVSSIFNADF